MKLREERSAIPCGNVLVWEKGTGKESTKRRTVRSSGKGKIRSSKKEFHDRGRGTRKPSKDGATAEETPCRQGG